MGSKAAKQRLVIRQDSREQHPLTFPPEWASTTVGTVPVGDYANEDECLAWEAAGKPAQNLPYAVERKSLADLVSSLIDSREHRKIIKAREGGINPLMYIVEANETDLINGYDYRKFLNKGEAMKKVIRAKLWDWRYSMGVQVVFTGNRVESAIAVMKVLERRRRQLAFTKVAEELKAKENDT